MTRHPRSRRILFALALLFTGLTFAPASRVMAQDEAPDSILSTYMGVFHPGRPTSVSVRLKLDQDRDILVDFLDKSGWYSGVRQFVKAGTDYASVTLDLPTTLREPQSAYVSVKIIPVGGQWFQKLAEVNQSVRFITLEAIPVPLHYAYPLSTFSDEVGRGISNHDGVRVFVRKNKDGYEMGYHQSGYGQEQELVMNLVSGDLNFRIRNSMNVTDNSSITAASIASDSQTRQAYLQHLQRMKTYFEHVESGRMADLSGDYPILREANQYLRQVLVQLNPVTRDKVDAPALHNPVGGPYVTPRPGKKLAVKVHYEASVDRDLVLVVKTQERVLSTQRFPAGAGSDTLVLPVVLPKDAPTQVEADFQVTLVPRDASLEASLAQAERQASILPLNNIDGVYVSEQVDSLENLYMSVNYSTVEPLDLRVDLYDANGSRLDRIQTALDVTELGSVYTLQFPGSHELQTGRTYTLVFRLVPRGSTSENGLSDVVKFFHKRDVN